MDNIRLDYRNMMEICVGKHGVKKQELDNIQKGAARIFERIENKRSGMVWRDLPYSQEEIVADIKAFAGHVRQHFKAFVVFGIGGSALGPIAAQQMLNHLRWNELPDDKRRGPKLYVEDNVDPTRMTSLLDVIEIEKTCFNIVSKSGSTSETMAQFLIISSLLKERLGEKWAENIVVTTDIEKGNLCKLAEQYGFKKFIVPEGVGGRFSQLCPVGLLPAAVCGMDIENMLQGAADMDKICSVADVYKNPAFMCAALQHICMCKGKNITVMMPYADTLKYMADWFAQLWAESLGKKYDLDGKVVHTGQTPVKALGVTDQHSQVQLYTEGPDDKNLVFLALDTFSSEFEISKGFEEYANINFLCGHSLSELIDSERKATEYAVTKAGKPNMTIYLPRANEYFFGQLVYLLEMQTAIAGELLCIDAFDQPGVEAGKNATYALMGREGYEDLCKELLEAQGSNDYLI